MRTQSFFIMVIIILCSLTLQLRKESLVQNFFVTMRLHWSKEAINVVSILWQTGIYKHWTGTNQVLMRTSWLKQDKKGKMSQDLYSYRSPKPLTLDSMLRIVFLVYAVGNCVGVAVWLGEVGLMIGQEFKKVWTEVKLWFGRRLGR